MSLHVSFFVCLKFRWKSCPHFCHCQFTSFFFILCITVYRSKNFNRINLIRLNTDFDFLDTWEEIVIKSIGQICLQILIFDCTKIIETLDFDKFLASFWFKFRWNSNDGRIDIFLIWDLFDEYILVGHRIISDICQHYNSMFILRTESIRLSEFVYVLERFSESLLDRCSAWFKLFVDCWLEIFWAEVFFECAFDYSWCLSVENDQWKHIVILKFLIKHCDGFTCKVKTSWMEIMCSIFWRVFEHGVHGSWSI